VGSTCVCYRRTTTHLTNAYVSSEFRRRGVFTTMLVLAINASRLRGAERLAAYAAMASLPIFLRYGFVAQGKVRSGMLKVPKYAGGGEVPSTTTYVVKQLGRV